MSKIKSLLDRHYSTIGIGDIFLSPPPHALPSEYFGEKDTAETKPFHSWEIVGTLKESPEDFVVKEIAPEDCFIPGISKDQARSILVADLRADEGPTFPHDDTADIVSNGAGEMPLETQTQEIKETELSSSQPNADPKIVLREVLVANAIPLSEKSTTWLDDLMHQLDSLQSKATGLLSAVSDKDIRANESVHLPPLQPETPKEERGRIHRAIQSAYILLRSNTTRDGSNQHTIIASIDDLFHGLRPFLLDPKADITSLHEFLSEKYVPPPDEYRRNTKRRRRYRRKSNSKQDVVTAKSSIVLRLKPGLSKEDRRRVHTLVDSQSRGRLATSTVKQSSTIASDGIAVFWSQKEERFHCQRKRKADGSSTKRSFIRFVLRKRQREHLLALQTVARALHCRQSDLAVAGIKDMQAISFQFATAKGVSIESAVRAKAFLQSKGFDIGRIHTVDFALSTGDLQGNRFEITLRKIRRVLVSPGKDGWLESLVECEDSHSDTMAQRVKDKGFINFFGEQRVGDAGLSRIVGVRSFDIGRALLRNDYKLAVWLIMTGRSSVRGSESEGDDILKVRRTWKETDGDPYATWKVLPRRDCLHRETLILKGLKRYGANKYEEALGCIPYQQLTYWLNAYQSFIWNKMTSTRLERYGFAPVEGDLVRKGNDIIPCPKESKFSIYDVVLPLPGSDIQYPKNEIAALYKEFLEEDDVSFSTPVLSHLLKGSYRYVACKPENVSCTKTNDSLKLSFDLPKGSFATMLMREFMLTTLSRSQGLA